MNSINHVSDVDPAYRKLLMTNAVVRHAWQTAMENDFTNDETLKYIICATAHVIDERIKDDMEKLNATPSYVFPTNCPYCRRINTQPTIPPAVREAAVRLQWSVSDIGIINACQPISPYANDHHDHRRNADIRLVCQHVLGREQT